jgi:outer membrane protein assembly factor BamB
MIRFVVPVLSGLVLSGLTFAADPSPWPQFRGPNGSGVADTQKPPIEFGPDKNVKWKVPVPDGMSSPIVAGDKLVLTAFDGGKLYTVAYTRADGKEAWRKEAPAKTIEAYFKAGSSPAAPTPATDGERIVSYFGSCGLICYDLSGKELWRYEMPTAVTAAGFGTAASPVIADGLVVVIRDEKKDSKAVAVDLATGSRKWETKRQSPASYCTPVVWDTPGGKQVVAAGHGKMVAYDLKTGNEKWSVAGMPTGCCTSPVATADALLFAGWSPGGADDKENQLPPFDGMMKQADADKDGAFSRAEAETAGMKDFFDGMDENADGKITKAEWEAVLKYMADGKNWAFAVKPGASGDVTRSLLWTKTKGLPYITTGIAYRGQFVTVRDGGLVTAYDAKSGKDVYVQERAVAGGQYYASPVAANGHIYTVTLEDGTFTVFKAGETEPEVVAKNPKLGERVAATPAVADDTLYVRGAKHLWAFGAKK